MLGPAVELANATLAAQDVEPLPVGLTPHCLRRTFASILVALGRDPAVVMRQMGHSTPAFTLSVYAAAMDWREGERERLRALVEGESWAVAGKNATEEAAQGLLLGEPEGLDSACRVKSGGWAPLGSGL